jgi:excisionase family DNA binding protein
MPLDSESKALARDEDGADLDRILGDKPLYTVTETARILGVSTPTCYRAMRKGSLPWVWNGDRRNITRPVLKRRAREGLGRLT